MIKIHKDIITQLVSVLLIITIGIFYIYSNKSFFKAYPNTTGIYSDGHIQMTIPLTWKKVTISSSGNNTTVTGYTDGTGVLKILSIPATPDQINQNIDNAQSEISAQYGASSTVELITLAGQKAVYIKLELGHSAINGKELEEDIYAFGFGGTFYTLSEIAPKSTFVAEQPIFNTIIKSISFKM